MMKLVCSISLVILILANSFTPKAEPLTQSSIQSTGKLVGLVLDINEARVPAAKIIIVSKGFRLEAVSAEDGSYEIALPEGKYNITVLRDDFYPFRKAGVQIQPNVTTKLDVTLKGRRVDEEHP